jgi:hypothetical protein
MLWIDGAFYPESGPTSLEGQRKKNCRKKEAFAQRKKIAIGRLVPRELLCVSLNSQKNKAILQ